MSSLTLTGSRKRPLEDSLDKQPIRAPKRQMRVRPNGMSAELVIFQSMPEAGTNRVLLHERDFQKLFPQASGLSDPLIQVANRVYEVVSVNWLEPGQIGVNKAQILDLRPYAFGPSEDRVLIVPFKRSVPSATQINVRVDLQEAPSSPRSPVPLDIDKLREQFFSTFKGKVFTEGQLFYMPHEKGLLKIKVSKLAGGEASTKIGQLSLSTFAKFQVASKQRVSLVDSVDEEEVESYQLRISCVDKGGNEWYKGHGVPPLVLDPDEIKYQVISRLKGSEIAEGHQLKIHHNAHWSYQVELEDVLLWDEDLEVPDHKQVYQLTDPSKIELLPSFNVLLREEPLGGFSEAEELTLSVIAAVPKDLQKPSETLSVGVNELTEEFLDKYEGMPLAPSEQFTLRCASGKYLFQVKNLKAKEGEGEEPSASCEVSDQTKVKLQVAQGAALNLVDTTDVMPLSSVSFEIQRVRDLLPEQLKAMLGSAAPLEIEEKEIKQALLQVLPKKISSKQKVPLLYKEEQLILTVTQRSVKGDKPPETTHGYLGAVTGETTIKFEAKKGGTASLAAEVKPIDYKNLDAEIAKLGLGGVKDELKQLVRDIIISRGPLKSAQKKLGLNPPRGLLLYGPPGTGKTTLARGLGSLLGCSGNRLQMLSAPEIWKKYVGESEEKVRELFQPARDAAEKKGDDAPLYMIVIDEIEAILGKRKEDSKRWETSVVDQILGELDGLKSLNNVLFVGMTNHRNQLDPAILRPGRLDTQIELPMPDQDARKEIFDIHLKELVSNGMLGADVDLDALVGKTDRFTGSHIKGLVGKASRIMLARVHERTLDGSINFDDMMNDPKAKVSMEDFLKAIEEIGVRGPSEDPSYAKIPPKNLVGVVNALYYKQSGDGGLNHIQVGRTWADKWGTFKYTGTLGKMTEESIKAAEVTAWNLLPKSYVNKVRSGKPFGLHIHYPGIGVQVDGPSAGCALVLAMISAITNIPIRRDVAMTGECDISGNALPIGGLDGKLPGAKRAGAKVVLVPDSNKVDLDKVIKKKPKLVEAGKFDVVIVKHMKDVIEAALTRPLPSKKKGK